MVGDYLGRLDDAIVVGGVGVLGDGDLVLEAVGAADGRVDAPIALHARDYQLLYTARVQLGLQSRLVEGVGGGLVDDELARAGAISGFMGQPGVPGSKGVPLAPSCWTNMTGTPASSPS